MAYSPKYVELDDIPVQIPDEYEPEQKRDALRTAETMLELDLNGGDRIQDANVTEAHKAAVEQRGTYELAKSADDPDSTNLGDLQDAGTTKTDYAIEAFRNEYDRIVARIQRALDSDEGRHVYNTQKSEDQRDLDRFFDQTDRDIDDVGDRVI